LKKTSRIAQKLLLLSLIMLMGMLINSNESLAAKKYTVKVSTAPVNSSYKKLPTYNKKTKHYYMLKSYLEKLESKGGGTLTLKKGTYNIPCTLYIPSNVTINLKKGVTIKKTLKTGTKKLKASKTLFEVVPSKIANSKKKTVKKYAGSSNVTIKSTGNAKITLASTQGTTAIVAGHNKNLTISGVKFYKMNGGSFIDLAATKNVTITGCTFYGSKAVTKEADKYAIRLNVPDKKTKNFKYKWSKTDSKPNTGITIDGNKFNKLNSAIGSYKYTENVYHKNIKITNNTFTSLNTDAIRILNWDSPSIENNTFSKIIDSTPVNQVATQQTTTTTQVTDTQTTNTQQTVTTQNVTTSPTPQPADQTTTTTTTTTTQPTMTPAPVVSNPLPAVAGIYASGVKMPVIVANTFDNVSLPIKFAPAVNTGAGKTYATSFNTIDDTTKSLIVNNIVTNASVYYIPYQTTLSSSKVIRIGYFMDLTTKEYTIVPGQNPYRDYYTDNTWYNSYTRDYYVFKSYLEQLERVGGGTLNISAGTYSITNSLYIPSNTKIVMKDGAVINKGTYTGFPENILVPSQSVFQLAEPANALGTDIVGGYDGAHDIEIVGEGTAIMDMLFYYGATAVVMAHNNNITIRNIEFRNYMGHHFIELNSSQNVLIENCSFIGSKSTSSKDDHKEAINIDTPDANTNGLNLKWPKHDRTPTNNVTIQNSKFDGSLRAIGSHKYSVSLLDNITQVYHTNLNILNNNISNTGSYGIRGINWKNCVIKGNTFKNIKSGSVAAINLSGAVNPTITGNTFDTANRPIILTSTDNSDSTLADKAYPKTDTILDSKDPTGKNLADMLNNILIDIAKPEIVYYVGGNKKENSTETLVYTYDPSKVSYTKPTPTPKPTATPTPSPTPETSPSPDPEVSPSPAPSPSPSPEVPAA